MKIALTLVALALLPTAGASAQSLENGSVDLRLNAAVVKKLKKEGMQPRPLKPAHLNGLSLRLPVTESSLEPRDGNGYLYLGGGFRWRVGKRVATFRRLLFNIEKHALVAAVDGTTMKVAELLPQQETVSGFDVVDAIKSMKLTARGASTLNHRLGLQGVFKAGLSLGAATVAGRFERFAVTGGEISLTIDSAFSEKLQSVEAEVRPSSLLAPLVGGQITSSLSGLVHAENGFIFVQHDVSRYGEPFDHFISFLNTYVSLETHTVSGAANVTFGPTHPSSADALATFPAELVEFNAETGEASISSLPLALDARMASLLNETMGAAKGKPSLFSAGEPLGTAAFVARTR